MIKFVKQVRRSVRTHDFADQLGMKIIEQLDETEEPDDVVVHVRATRGSDGLNITARVLKSTPLEVVLDAAGDWVNEMREYIIPQLVKDGEDVSGQEAHAAEIDRAIETLTGEEQV